MMLRVAVLLGAACFILQGISASHLFDNNFESITQAATGQTTGVWVVKFCSHSKKECQDLQYAWDQLAAELFQQQVFLAEVDTDTNPRLKKRFGIHRDPTIYLFRDRKMFLFPATAFSDMTAGLREFVLSGYETARSTPVPPPVSSAGDLFHELRSHLGLIGTVLGILAAVGVFASGVLAVAKPKRD